MLLMEYKNICPASKIIKNTNWEAKVRAPIFIQYFLVKKIPL